MLDAELAIGFALPDNEFSWAEDDVARYHLALGAGARHTDPAELRYLLDAPHVLPTFGMTVPAALGIAAAQHYHAQPPEIRFPGVELDLAKLVHARQEIVVHRPLPPSGTGTASSRITALHDKGSAAIIVQEASLTSAGQSLLSFRTSIHARGEGGFGGDRGASAAELAVPMPERAPDAVVVTKTLPQQALLYRLCGERNAVHADPERAREAGFPGPTLQGVCVYGMVCKAVTDAVLDADPTRIRRYEARFAGVVFPGEVLETRVWRSGDEILFTTVVPGEPERPVLADCRITCVPAGTGDRE
ncbi:MaoC/PaaZ C-terminal domain-containing protein [Allokutzneria sp. NRRL B-24872]|uniref:MaoC/PaaZ C-terminal domain-containing protein n=1 Tax=Allokutzneria sp. NRRL B-24872 TaxID=1137961 RepID=UPI000A37BB32|nr:MaoC/PaaZ C-terminal domain-containing protein [Allokutzneria sp. NRRL B-24872]